MKRIAIDTNMLAAIGQLKIDIFEEAEKMFGKSEFILPEQVMHELALIESKGGKAARAARVARKVMETKKFRTVKLDARNADDALAELAREGATVATNDRILRKRIKGFGKVIYLKKGKIIAED